MQIRSRSPARSMMRACSVAFVIAATMAPGRVEAQWSTTYEQFYMPGAFNWQFRRNYPAADRLFNAFDYGHAILYETLWTKPGAPVSDLEEKQYDFITRELLVHPPRVPLEESAIEVAYAKLAPEAKMMFDWAHLLHRQIYDVWSDESLSPPEKDAKVAELVRYYKSRPDLAFSSQPKTMELMEGQPYSTAFRKSYPKFNGLIWAYHWLQVGLYEPLLVGKNKDERQTGVLAAVARFRQMIENPPTNMPRIMPMTAAISPAFAARYPEAAIIFDNLHSMHDVVSDILANPIVPRNKKREEILRAASRYRDQTSYVQSVAEWRDMAQMMGVENMGGAVLGTQTGFPTPTVERGAVMMGMDHAKMNMGKDSAAMPGMDHSKMAMPGARDSSKAAAMDHSKMNMPGMADSLARKDTASRMAPMPGMKEHQMAGAATDSVSTDVHARLSAMMELQLRMMMAEPGVHKRIMADTAMHRLMLLLMPDMAAIDHASGMKDMNMRGMTMPSKPPTKTAPKKPAVSTKRPTEAKVPSLKPATTKKTPADTAMKGMKGMDHKSMPGMRMPGDTTKKKPPV